MNVGDESARTAGPGRAESLGRERSHGALAAAIVLARPGFLLSFTLIELLVVVTIIAILAALLLPALARSKAEGRRVKCVNLVHQMGIALQLYVDDNHQRYPYYWGPPPSMGYAGMATWKEYLEPYYVAGWWTNRAYQCPEYKEPPNLFSLSGRALPFFGSYAYNTWGTDRNSGLPESTNHLGLGNTQFSDNPPYFVGAVQESQVMVPSDMFAISDARIVGVPGGVRIAYNDLMWILTSRFDSETNGLRHVGKGYNVVFADGHVRLMNRSDYLDPRRTALNWNNDHQSHPETWNYWFNPENMNRYSP